MHRNRIIAFIILILATVSIPQAMAITPYAGVNHYLTPECGTNWVPVNLAGSDGQKHGNYFVVYNEPDGHSCVRSQDGRNGNLSWYVSSRTYHGGSVDDWEYAFIGSGWYYGNYTCKYRSAQSATSACQAYPVQLSHDGFPRTSAQVWPHMNSGITDYDLWVSDTSTGGETGKPYGAEVMIWLNHPGIPLSNYRILWSTVILGKLYYVTGWNDANGTYTAYIAAHEGDYLPVTWLNHFFRDAARHGRLSMNWWLTAIDFGAEMNPVAMPGWMCPDGRVAWCVSGTGFAVKSYKLYGLPAVGQDWHVAGPPRY